jgi:hypothetical protein
MTNGNRYFGVAAGVGLVVVTMSLTGAGQAVAQNLQKTVTSLIVNDALKAVKQTPLSGVDQWVASESVQMVVESGKAPLLTISTDTGPVSPFVMFGGIAGVLVPVP